MKYGNCYDVSDVDECVEGFDGCGHNCTNTNGSYFCTCLDGYELDADNQTCTGNDYTSVHRLTMGHYSFSSLVTE